MTVAAAEDGLEIGRCEVCRELVTEKEEYAQCDICGSELETVAHLDTCCRNLPSFIENGFYRC